MEKEIVERFLSTNATKLPAEQLPFLREKLLLNDIDPLMLEAISLHDPMVLLLVSIFVGHIGIDRFIISDIGMGILKLLTWGGLGIIWIYDIVTIQNKVRQKNFEKLLFLLR